VRSVRVCHVRARILNEYYYYYYYYIVHKPAWCVFELCKRHYADDEGKRRVVFRVHNNWGVESRTCALEPPLVLPPIAVGGCKGVRAWCPCVVYFGRSSRRKRVGEISYRIIMVHHSDVCEQRYYCAVYDIICNIISIATRHRARRLYGRVRVKWNI